MDAAAALSFAAYVGVGYALAFIVALVAWVLFWTARR